MRLFKEVPITSAEQAEALPGDAIVIGVETGERYTRTYEGDWWGVTEMGTRLGVDLDAGDAVVALVPIEAEEEWGVRYDDPDEGGGLEVHINEGHARAWAYSVDGTALSRFTTPWEPA